MLTEFQQQMADAVNELRPGEVVSFGDIAAAAGRPNAARAAGRMLSESMDTLPWWRVVYSDGHLPHCNPTVQSERLADEGVQLNAFRVVRSPLGRFQG
jgi:methylated-DNA-protein-cysteine methyltransferase-like protein